MKWYLFIILGFVCLLLYRPADGPAVSAGNAAGVVNWSQPIHISTTSSQAVVPVIQTAPNGTIMIMFNHGATNKDPYYSVSTTQGATWSTPAPVHSSSESSEQIDFAFDGQSRAHAVWANESLNTLRYANQDGWPGETTVIATSSEPAQQLKDPRVTAHGNGIIDVVWSATFPADIFHSRSINNGQSWTTPQAIASADESPQRPAIAVDASGNVHVVWEESLFVGGEPTYRIHYLKGTPSPSNMADVVWPASPTVISNAPTVVDAREPAIALTGNTIHVSFTNYVTRDEQYAFYTRFAANNWSAPVDTTHEQYLTVNVNAPFNLVTTLAVCNDDTVYLYYHGTTHSDGREQVWGASALVNEANNGSHWILRERATNTDYDNDGEPNTRTIYPHLSCTSGGLHLAYQDNSIGAQGQTVRQIYYTNRIEVLFLPIIQRN